MKTRIAIVRDHSASMKSIVKGAINDYNLTLEGIKNSSSAINDIKLTVVECGRGFLYENKVVFSNRDINSVYPIAKYDADGSGTPLWDAVVLAINNLNNAYPTFRPPINEQESFLVMVITDGQDNRSRTKTAELARIINHFQATDVWTFVFRVPVGYKRHLVSLGIPEGNVIEWEQTNESLGATTKLTSEAISTYFTGQTQGIRSTRSFYSANLHSTTITEVKRELDDVSEKVDIARVWTADDGIQIRDFCNIHFNEYKAGRAYYELIKPETVQENKKIILKHLKKGKYFSGPNTRNMLGFPDYGDIKIRPGDHGEFEIYIQSTSVNRKLSKNTNVLYLKD